MVSSDFSKCGSPRGGVSSGKHLLASSCDILNDRWISSNTGSPIQVLGLADNEAMVGKTLTGGTFVFKEAGNDEWVSLSSPELIGNLPWQIQEVIQYTPEGFLLVKASLEQPGPDLVRHLLLQPSVES
jgi:hypothetical protein